MIRQHKRIRFLVVVVTGVPLRPDDDILAAILFGILKMSNSLLGIG